MSPETMLDRVTIVVEKLAAGVTKRQNVKLSPLQCDALLRLLGTVTAQHMKAQEVLRDLDDVIEARKKAAEEAPRIILPGGSN